MVDVALAMRERALGTDSSALARYGVAPGGYVLATAHRAANVDDRAALERLHRAARGGRGAGDAATAPPHAWRGSRAHDLHCPGGGTPPR